MTKAEKLDELLRLLAGTSADIEATAIISTDGLVMASRVPGAIDDDRLGAISAAMLSLGDRAASELGRGALEQVLVKGEQGYIMLIHAGPDSVLTVLTRSTAKLGLIFLDIKRVARQVALVLK